MKQFFRPLVVTASLAVIAWTPGAMAADPVSSVPAGYETTGASVNCLRQRQVRDTDPLDDFNILFEAAGGKLYLNRLSGRCAGLTRQGRFTYQSPQAQICKGDIITVLDSFGNVRGGCALGSFDEVTELDNPNEAAQ